MQIAIIGLRRAHVEALAATLGWSRPGTVFRVRGQAHRYDRGVLRLLRHRRPRLFVVDDLDWSGLAAFDEVARVTEVPGTDLLNLELMRTPAHEYVGVLARLREAVSATNCNLERNSRG